VTSPPIDKIEEMLRLKPAHFLLLRNFNLRETLARGGDVDLLVSSHDEAEKILNATVGPPLCKTIRYYVTSYFYPWGHLDVADRILWKSIPYLAASDVWDRSYVKNGITVPDAVDEAIICWFASLLWGGFTKEKYKGLIHDAAKTLEDVFTLRLAEFLGEQLAQKLVFIAQQQQWDAALTLTGKIKRKLILHNGIARSLYSLAEYAVGELKLRFQHPMPILAFLGPDGCGKSSVINELKNRHIGGGWAVMHWRPGVIPAIGVATGARVESTGPVEDPHGKPPHSSPVSFLRLIYYLCDYWIGWIIKVLDLSARNKVVIFDRYAYDMAIDPRRFRFNLPTFFLRWAIRLAPLPDLVFCLDAPVDVLQSRKQEVSKEETARQRGAYRSFVESLPNGHVIDASLPLEQVTDAVAAIILDFLASRVKKISASSHGD
jgi:thymidylate kinase